jgi:hypothetical protein
MIPDHFVNILDNICYKNIEYTDLGSLQFTLT